jgi:hypothetical protein
VQGALLPDWIGATVALLILIAFTYTQFRHIGLALAAALAPLPGYGVAIALHMPSQPLAYLCGFFAALVLSSEIEARICDGVSARAASKQTAEMSFPILVWPIALTVCAPAVLLFVANDFSPLAFSLAVGLCGASALIVVLAALRFLPYGEEFIARANRLREKRERWLDGLAFVVQPRWGWSVGGIALIFAILGFSGGENSGAEWPFASPAASPMLAALFAIFAYVTTRNMRRAAAFLLAVAVLGCLTFWICGRIAFDAGSLPLAIALASGPALIVAGQATAFARAGDNVAVATLRSLEQLATPVAFFCLAGVPVLCIFGAFGAAMLIASGGIAALVVFPALTTAIYDLLPPRVSLDAYRVR